MKHIFIDKFYVPLKAKKEFMERMNQNRNFIQKQDGFESDAAYERVDEYGNFIIVTIATWENEDALKKAKEAVQVENKKNRVNTEQILKRLNISKERGIYKEIQ